MTAANEITTAPIFTRSTISQRSAERRGRGGRHTFELGGFVKDYGYDVFDEI